MTKPIVRVRLAPSPTGEVHIGTIWMALFNWLFARQHGGQLILRIEDTDRKRLVPGSADRILEALKWYGITIDEGPEQGGPFAPYIQSERLPLYKQYAEQLVTSGHAYYCFCTPERLEKLRADQQAQKLPPRYDKHCSALPATEVTQRLGAHEPAVIRMNLPTTGSLTIEDVVRTTVTFRYDVLDDSIIMKTDGFPTYHLANVVDDYVMGITHVIRAEEWLASLPKHVFLYNALGWALPIFAHLPWILGSDRQKLSKRHGSTSALSFRDEGYLPEAMRNFLALMGWHPKGESEILTTDQMIAEFSLEEINPSGAIFDRTKLEWFNGWYIRQLPVPELVERLTPFWHVPADLDQGWKERAAMIVRDRLKRLNEIDDLTRTLSPTGWDEALVNFSPATLIPKKHTATDVQSALAWISEQLPPLDVANPGASKTALIEAITVAGLTNMGVLWPLRVALTLQTSSPDVFDVLGLLGIDEALRRIEAIRKLPL